MSKIGSKRSTPFITLLYGFMKETYHNAKEISIKAKPIQPKSQAKEESEIFILVMSLPWIAAIAGSIIMKRIQPENRLYPMYAFGICIVVTVLVGAYVSVE